MAISLIAMVAAGLIQTVNSNAVGGAVLGPVTGNPGTACRVTSITVAAPPGTDDTFVVTWTLTPANLTFPPDFGQLQTCDHQVSISDHQIVTETDFLAGMIVELTNDVTLLNCSITVAGLTPSHHYYVSIRERDPIRPGQTPAWTAFYLPSAQGQTGDDHVDPGPVSFSLIEMSDRTARLSCVCSGDDGPSGGAAALVLIRAAKGPILTQQQFDDSSYATVSLQIQPGPPPYSQVILLQGMDPLSSYWIQGQAVDNAGNLSSLPAGGGFLVQTLQFFESASSDRAGCLAGGTASPWGMVVMAGILLVPVRKLRGNF